MSGSRAISIVRRLEIRLELPLGSPKLCNSILSALNPDNRSVPPGQVLINSCEEGLLVAVLRGDVESSRDILTLRNTADDYLEHLQTALRVLLSVES